MDSAQRCFACGQTFAGSERLVLVRGKTQEEHCSEYCLETTVRQRQIASATTKSRWMLRLLAVLLAFAGGSVLWQRVRTPARQTISFDPPAERPERKPPLAAIAFGPPWPPSDADWSAVFAKASWIYPLPGPVRRTPTNDSRVLGPEPSHPHEIICRTEGHCAVDLGGDLWGEYVYAVQDGVVGRVQRADSDGRGEYVRLSHFGGFVFTQYCHLAAIPRSVTPGARIKAGDVIGLVGDTGSEPASRHLYFSLSVWPVKGLAEMYWDPTPLMAAWPLRSPSHGTVAGFSPEKEGETTTQAAPPNRAIHLSPRRLGER